MKKFILITGIMFFTLLQTKAQQEKQFAVANYVTALNSTVLPWENNNSNNLYTTATNAPDKDHDFYMHRSRNLRITGLSLLGAGLVLGVSGILVSSSTSTPNNYDTRDQTIATLFIASAATGIASIPLMAIASVYKHKAKLMVSTQKTGFGVPSNVSKDITGISITIPIGK